MSFYSRHSGFKFKIFVFLKEIRFKLKEQKFAWISYSLGFLLKGGFIQFKNPTLKNLVNIDKLKSKTKNVYKEKIEILIFFLFKGIFKKA